VSITSSIREHPIPSLNVASTWTFALRRTILMESFITTIPLLLLLQTVKQQNTRNDDHTKRNDEFAEIPNDPNLYCCWKIQWSQAPGVSFPSMGWKKAVAHPTLRSYYYYLLIAPSSLSPTLSLPLSPLPPLSPSLPLSLSLSRQRLPEAGKMASWTRSRNWKPQGPKT